MIGINGSAMLIAWRRIIITCWSRPRHLLYQKGCICSMVLTQTFNQTHDRVGHVFQGRFNLETAVGRFGMCGFWGAGQGCKKREVLDGSRR